MSARDAQRVWEEQCEAAAMIKERFGVTGAFDYLVGQKLMNFFETASRHPEFARELPRFVSEVRRQFTHDEIRAHLAQIERVQNEEDVDSLEEDDPFRESPDASPERVRQFMLLKGGYSSLTINRKFVNSSELDWNSEAIRFRRQRLAIDALRE